MYHETGFDPWWDSNGPWYESQNITKESFENFPFFNGLNKGDVIFVFGKKVPKEGDVIIFQSSFTYPIIHRVVSTDPLSTKGDHNAGQLVEERSISEDAVVGQAVGRIPGLGWLKLIFFEGMKSPEQRGFCT